jgi:DNA polymerase III delta' subunit
MLIGHKKQWEFLKKKLELNQLSHAYLFTGAKEIGKKTFAVEFVKLLNCLEPEKKPCGKCVNCQTIEKNSFPDLLIVKSINSTSSIKNKKDSLEIDIGQIRAAQNFLSYKSYYGSFKSIIIDDAERMNQEAQSCFLKTLEEPKGKTLLILVSSKPDILLPTIASRCQTLKLSRPKDLPVSPERLKKEQEILKDLLPVINSDLSAKFKYAKSFDFDKQDLSEILEVMQKYLRQLLFIETGVGSIKDQQDLPALKNASVKKIKDIINLIEDINGKLLFTNANPKLALEILLMEF